jgi:hypothetical protein
LNRPTAAPLPLASLQLRTDAGCELAIGPWPRFRYDARTGGGPGRSGLPDAEGWCALVFEPEPLQIPPLNARTARILGLPLPPGLAIAIRPLELAGRWRPQDGAVDLAFDARFELRLAGRMVAPELTVTTRLGSGPVEGRRQRALGRPLDGDGRGVLVAVAEVPSTGALWLDRFLGLPGEALAVLRCQLIPAEVP